MKNPIKEAIEEKLKTGNTRLKLRPGYGEILTGKRIEKGLTIAKLSDLSGVPGWNILNIEKEDSQFSLHNLSKYLEALDIPASEVFYD